MVRHLHFLTNLGRHAGQMYDCARGLFDLGLPRLQGARRNDERSRRGASRSEKNPILIHYHIFKNAGSSFEWALEQNIGKRLKRFDKETPGGAGDLELSAHVAATTSSPAAASIQASSFAIRCANYVRSIRSNDARTFPRLAQ